MSNMGQSGKGLGDEYLRKIQTYLSTQDALPVSKDGSLNITAIAEQAGISKQSIYKNPAIRAAIKEAKAARGVESWSERRANAPKEPVAKGEAPPRVATCDSKRLQAAEWRVAKLEQQNAALTAENHELRRQVKELKQQLGRQDMMIDTGRRIPGPTVKYG